MICIPLARGKKHKHFWCVKLVGIGLGLTMIPVICYTYTGIFGISVNWLNIASFFLAAGAAFWVENKLLQQEHACRLHPRVAFFLMCMIGIIFTVFTFFPSEISIFKDPMTAGCGFQG